MMKISKLFIAYLLTIWPIIMFFLFAIITDRICVFYNGFAVDSDSNLYLGKGSTIEVLNNNGKPLRKISSYTSRGYKFTITENNTIKISTGDYLYETDLFGKLINKKVILDYTEDELVGINKHRFITANGTVYEMKNYFLRTYIYRLEEPKKEMVYKMPIFDYVIELLAIVSFLSLIVVVLIYVMKCRKEHGGRFFENTGDGSVC